MSRTEIGPTGRARRISKTGHSAVEEFEKPMPFLWLDEYEQEAVADCGCRLAVSVDEPKGQVGAAFYQCERHAEVNP